MHIILIKYNNVNVLKIQFVCYNIAEARVMDYKKGDYVVCSVTGIEKYGIFVELDNDYSGLIHISEISNSYIKDIDTFTNVGDKIRAKVLEVDKDNKQLKLSIKNVNYKSLVSKRTKIVETESGFTPLKDNLDTWIKDKLADINKKSDI